MGCQLLSVLHHGFKGVSSAYPGLWYLDGAEVSGDSVPRELCSLHYTSIPILTLPGLRELHFFFFNPTRFIHSAPKPGGADIGCESQAAVGLETRESVGECIK